MNFGRFWKKSGIFNSHPPILVNVFSKSCLICNCTEYLHWPLGTRTAEFGPLGRPRATFVAGLGLYKSQNWKLHLGDFWDLPSCFTSITKITSKKLKMPRQIKDNTTLVVYCFIFRESPILNRAFSGDTYVQITWDLATPSTNLSSTGSVTGGSPQSRRPITCLPKNSADIIVATSGASGFLQFVYFWGKKRSRKSDELVDDLLSKCVPPFLHHPASVIFYPFDQDSHKD